VTFGPDVEHRAASCCNPKEVDRNGLEVLSREGCLCLLASATLGRVAFTSGALPRVLPVSFHLDRERILVGTGRGSQLDVALQDVVVAFEADDFDLIHHSGWSVAVTGVATEVSDPTELDRARQLPVARWAPAGDEVVISISTELVSGRRTATGSLATQLGPRLTRAR
jgi:nitroimidazol reductase NimA-like FMN-containing flavoprotein (pyridoxamine 5'-phosphate oxidase superfamily)